MDDRELLERFEAGTIPRAEWTHAVHLRVAYLYVSQRPFDEAVDRMSCGIRRLNEAIGVVNGPDSGYHETITQAWLRVIRARVEASNEPMTSDAFLERHADMLDKRMLLRFYTRDVINAPAARFEFVPPDVQPFE
jgi:hypothetical protein